MRNFRTAIWIIAIVAITARMVSCTSQSKPSEKKSSGDSVLRDDANSSVPDSFTGTFEYREPHEDGYLYYNIEIAQDGENVKGTLSAGNYLSSNGGGYMQPNAL